MFGKLLRLIFKEGSVEAIKAGILAAAIWPPLLTVVAVVIGAFQQVPLFYLLIGAAVMFAAVSTGLLRFSEWRFRQRVKDKLGFVGPRLGTKRNAEGAVEAISLGFELHNSADFPIHFEVQSLHTSAAGQFPPRKPYLTSRVEVPARGAGWFNDYTIRLPDPKPRSVVEGQLEFALIYGRSGRPLRLKFHKIIRLRIGFSDNGDVTADTVNWYEVAVPETASTA